MQRRAIVHYLKQRHIVRIQSCHFYCFSDGLLEGDIWSKLLESQGHYFSDRHLRSTHDCSEHFPSEPGEAVSSVGGVELLVLQ